MRATAVEPLSVTYRRRGGPHYICRRSCVLIGEAGLDGYVTAEVLAYLSQARAVEAAGRGRAHR